MINNQQKNIPILSNVPPTRQEVDILKNKVELLTKQGEIRTVKLGEANKEVDRNVISELVMKSNRILVSISTHKFPFDFFSNTINVEEGRVTVIIRTFFLSSQVHSVDIKDISNIFINTSPFFAQLVIVSKTFSMNEIKINNLWKNEAIYVRRIIEGLRTFASKAIDTSIYSREELIVKLKELSTTKIVT